jgi:hypothetical protein
MQRRSSTLTRWFIECGRRDEAGQLLVPHGFAEGQPKGLCLFHASVSIKAVAAVTTNDKAAIAFHHAISRLALFVLGLRRLLMIWRNKRIGIATLATVVRKTRF